MNFIIQTVRDTVKYQWSTYKCNIFYHVAEICRHWWVICMKKHPTPGQRLRPPLCFVSLHEVMTYSSYSMPQIMQILHPCCQFHVKKTNKTKHNLHKSIYKKMKEKFTQWRKQMLFPLYRMIVLHTTRIQLTGRAKIIKILIKHLMLQPDNHATFISEHLSLNSEFTYNALKTYSALHRHNTVNAIVKM